MLDPEGIDRIRYDEAPFAAGTVALGHRFLSVVM